MDRRKRREQQKIRAVGLAASYGTVQAVARVLHVSESTVRNWMKSDLSFGTRMQHALSRKTSGADHSHATSSATDAAMERVIRSGWNREHAASAAWLRQHPFVSPTANNDEGAIADALDDLADIYENGYEPEEDDDSAATIATQWSQYATRLESDHRQIQEDPIFGELAVCDDFAMLAECSRRVARGWQRIAENPPLPQ